LPIGLEPVANLLEVLACGSRSDLHPIQTTLDGGRERTEREVRIRRDGQAVAD
jgi:hypothetical protein